MELLNIISENYGIKKGTPKYSLLKYKLNKVSESKNQNARIRAFMLAIQDMVKKELDEIRELIADKTIREDRDASVIISQLKRFKEDAPNHLTGDQNKKFQKEWVDLLINFGARDVDRLDSTNAFRFLMNMHQFYRELSGDVWVDPILIKTKQSKEKNMKYRIQSASEMIQEEFTEPISEPSEPEAISESFKALGGNVAGTLRVYKPKASKDELKAIKDLEKWIDDNIKVIEKSGGVSTRANPELEKLAKSLNMDSKELEDVINDEFEELIEE